MTLKNVLTWMPKSNSSRKPFGTHHLDVSQTLLKSTWQFFYSNFPLIQNKLNWKTCLWIISKILWLFVHTLTAHNIYSPHNWQKFLQRLQRYLWKKWKINFPNFIAFLKSTQNLIYLEKNDQLDSLNISKVVDSKKCSSLNAKKQLF